MECGGQFGAEPLEEAVLRRVDVGTTVITAEHRKAVEDVLLTHRVSPGRKCEAFAGEFARMHGARRGLFVNSGTDALRIGLLALKERYGWSDGDSVIVPAVTFVASINVILQAGLRPLVVDVGMYDALLNFWKVDKVLRGMDAEDRAKVRAIMPVHLFGKRCDVDLLAMVVKKYGLRVIEDSCETMGVGPMVGDVACYSSYVCHLISTGVGGTVLTNDRKLGDLVWSYANHGRREKGKFIFDRIGYSSRATEMQAALGLVELKYLSKRLKRRREIAERLNDGLMALYDLMIPAFLGDTPHGFMMYPLALTEASRAKKDDLCAYLNRHGVETRELLPIVTQPCYKGILEFPGDDFEVAYGFAKRGFYIGCHPEMTDEDADYVIGVFKSFFRNLTKTK